MIAPVDYYAILGIPRNASAANIRAAYKREVRIWRKQASASSQGSIKNEAEKRLALLAEAFRVLSDTQQRAAYDRQAKSTSTQVAPPPTPVSVNMMFGNPVEQAEYYLAMADYHAAVQAAREATMNLGNSAESWSVLSRANAGLRQLDNAVYEARRAIELAPMNSEYHFYLGAIYEELNRWEEALQEYEQASQSEPAEPLYQLAIGGVLIQNNQPARALPIIEPIYSTMPDDEVACYYYAQALIAMAEAVPKDKSADGYAVTRAEEIQEMRRYLSRAANIQHLDQETKQIIRDTEAYLSRMEGHTFHVPLGASSFASEMMKPGLGCDGTIVMMAMLAALAFAPLLLLFWGFSLLTGDSAGSGFILLLISVGLGYVWYRSLWVPRWKVNARMRTHRIRYLS